MCVPNFRVCLLQNGVDILTFARKTCAFYVFSCLQLLSFSVGSSFCVMFHSIFNTGRSNLRTLALNVVQTCLGVPTVASFSKKVGKTYFPTETPDLFWPF